MEQNSNETPQEQPVANEATAPEASAEAPVAPRRTSRRATSKKVTEDGAEIADPAATHTASASAETAAAETSESTPAPKKTARTRKKAAPATPATDAESATTHTETADATATSSPEPAAEEAAPKTTTRRRKTVKETPAEEPVAAVEGAPEEAPKKRARRTTAVKKTAETDTVNEETPTPEAKTPAKADGDAAQATPETAEEAPKKTRSRAKSKAADEAPTDTAAVADTPAADEKAATDQKPAAEKKTETAKKADSQKRADNAKKTDSKKGQTAKSDAPESATQADSEDDKPAQKQSQRRGGKQDQQAKSEQGKDDDKERDEQQSSRSRTRQRDRKRRNQHNEDLIDPELTDEDVLLPIAGILDVLDNYAFVRTSGYLPGPSDVYVSLGQVKRYNLRKGDAIVGSIRKPHEHEGGGRQKYNAIVKIETLNGVALTEDMQRTDFADLTPLYPQERYRLETTPEKVTQRVIDLIAPIGKGQRGLIVAPPKAGKTVILQQIAHAVAANNPEAHVMMVLVDERPEEVTDMQRSIKGEVVASTFDRPAEDHTTVAELAIERAKRLVELGHDVVILLDSLTRLGRAYNLAAPHSGRVLSGGVDAQALYPPKKFFGAARNIENGGSLTIIATALVETGSRADEVIFEEFKGTGNMELRLDRRLADKRVFPAVNLNASSTRKEEMLLSPDEVKITWKLRRALGGLDEEHATETVLSKLRETQSNAEFLLLMQKSQGLS